MRMLLYYKRLMKIQKRSYNINQVSYLDKELGLNSILAYNFKVK